MTVEVNEDRYAKEVNEKVTNLFHNSFISSNTIEKLIDVSCS